MIQGMRLHITSADLLAHLREREAHHRGRQAFYTGKAAEMEAAGERPQNVTNDPVKVMTDRAEHHERRAAAFAVWVKYLIPGEMFQLDNNDLSRVEMASL